MKHLKKAVSVILCVALLVSGLVFTVPTAVGASYPDNLYNGSTKVSYTINDAQKGKYLVEIDAVKYNPNTLLEPQAIRSEAGDILITYRAENGTAPESTRRLEDVIPADAFNYTGEGTFAYYTVLDGFPQNVTASLKKTNTAANDSGLYTGVKVWNIGSGAFASVFDYTKIERSNGVGTGDLIFSSCAVDTSSFPYAVSGSASGSNLTLPAGLDAVSAAQSFYVTDQWGVTMMAPEIAFTPVTGLTFSQTANVMTVKGTGDANNPNGSSRSVKLTATYPTRNTGVANTYSLERTFIVYNSSTRTYAPTFENREKAGLALSFKTSTSSNVEKFTLNSAYKMTTTNYLVIKNNASRAATVNIGTTSSDKIRINPATDVIAAGATKNYQIMDLAAARENYNADITVTYTLEGLYDAATGTPAQLNAGATIPFIYNNVTTPFLNVYQKQWNMREVNVDVSLKGNSGVLYNQTSAGAISGTSDNFQMVVDCYVNRDQYTTYNAAGMGFRFTLQKSNHYKFNDENNHAGTYVQRGYYDAVGTFGFSENPGTHTDAYKDVIGTELGKESGNVTDQNFYGNIFTGSSTVDSPAQIYFNLLQIHCPTVVANSAYFDCTLNVYAYSKAALRTKASTCKSLAALSCYYNPTKWSAYTSMSSSALKTAQIQLGTDMTSQAKISAAATGLDRSYNELLSSATNGTYSLIHNKHTGDIGTAIEQTTVDYYVFENGASNVLKFNAAFASACNKHSDAYTPTLEASGTYEHTYDYWNIDFTGLLAALEHFDAVAPAGQFSNTDDAVGTQLYAARNVDTGSSSAQPQKQTDVENIINDLNTAMRNLKYTSFNMYVEHKMFNPTGTEVIENDIIQTRTETYNKTCTYGEVVDGTANLSDGTYTVKGYHFEPQPDATFKQYASSYYYQGISSEYLCHEEKEITMVYYAKPVLDETLKNYINTVETEYDTWEGLYTDASIDAFAEWYDAKTNEGAFSKAFSVFDEVEYQALVDEFSAEYAKLDKIATAEQIDTLSQFVADYEMLGDFSDAFCHSADLLAAYSDKYIAANDLLDLSETDNAGQNAADAVIQTLGDFELTYHNAGEHRLLTAPKDGVDGNYYTLCGNCAAIVESGVFKSPSFNTFRHPAYDYATRGAALRVESENTQSDTQGMRFAASCKVPADAEVVDFGFVFTQTKYLNGGKEPEDNTPVNMDLLVDGGMYISKMSMINGNYSVYGADDGSDIYTFNLVLNINRSNWNTHYAARSYVVYSINGMEVTVYDSGFSSRTAFGIAQKVMANQKELPETRAYIAEKFGL